MNPCQRGHGRVKALVSTFRKHDQHTPTHLRAKRCYSLPPNLCRIHRPGDVVFLISPPLPCQYHRGDSDHKDRHHDSSGPCNILGHQEEVEPYHSRATLPRVKIKRSREGKYHTPCRARNAVVRMKGFARNVYHPLIMTQGNLFQAEFSREGRKKKVKLSETVNASASGSGYLGHISWVCLPVSFDALGMTLLRDSRLGNSRRKDHEKIAQQV